MVPASWWTVSPLSSYMGHVPVSFGRTELNIAFKHALSVEYRHVASLSYAHFGLRGNTTIRVNERENTVPARHRVTGCDTRSSFIPMADKIEHLGPSPSVLSNPGLDIFSGGVVLISVVQQDADMLVIHPLLANRDGREED